MSRKDQLLRILAALDGHFAADDCSPADADRWRELKRHITRIKDGLDLARGAPQTKEIVGKALQHVRLGSARKPRKPDKETLDLVRLGAHSELGL